MPDVYHDSPDEVIEVVEMVSVICNNDLCLSDTLTKSHEKYHEICGNGFTCFRGPSPNLSESSLKIHRSGKWKIKFKAPCRERSCHPPAHMSRTRNCHSHVPHDLLSSCQALLVDNAPHKKMQHIKL